MKLKEDEPLHHFQRFNWWKKVTNGLNLTQSRTSGRASDVATERRSTKEDSFNIFPEASLSYNERKKTSKPTSYTRLLTSSDDALSLPPKPLSWLKDGNRFYLFSSAFSLYFCWIYACFEITLTTIYLFFLFVFSFFWRISSNSLTGLPNTQAFLWIAPVATRVEFQARY